MAYTTINKPSEYFNTKLYTGTSSTQSITGVNFQPDLVWFKRRDGVSSHRLTDAVRGTTKLLQTNANDADQTGTDTLTSFDSDGFTLGADTAPYNVNVSGQTMVAWNWKANGSGVSNTDGSITSTVSANTTSGFSIVTYTGTGANATVGTGLGVAPSIVLCKNLSVSGNWIMYHSTQGATKYMVLNATDAVATATVAWNDTAPTSSVFSVGTASTVNGSGNNLVAYCFAEKKGFSKFGSYTGNGNADGTFVYTGFKPAFVMIKNTSAAENWYILDNKRPSYNTNNYYIKPNVGDAEGTSTSLATSLLSNGFKLRTSNDATNQSGATYIYMAFAENPLVNSLGNPATAR